MLILWNSNKSEKTFKNKTKWYITAYTFKKWIVHCGLKQRSKDLDKKITIVCVRKSTANITWTNQLLTYNLGF